MTDLEIKIAKALCCDFGTDKCKKCSLGNPEAEYSCSVYDDAKTAAEAISEEYCAMNAKHESEMLKLQLENDAFRIKINKLELKINNLIEELSDKLDDILFRNKLYPVQGEDFEPYYLEDLEKEISFLKQFLNIKYLNK